MVWNRILEKLAALRGTATALLPRISRYISQDDRLRMEGNVKVLRSRLDQVPVCANQRP